MRVRLTLLLLAMLPMLVLPAGVLRFCLCPETQPASKCCSQTSCCDDTVPDRQARLSADTRCSGCQTLLTPKRDAIEPSKSPSKQSPLSKLAPLSMVLLPLVQPVQHSRVTLVKHKVSALSPSRTPPLLI